jgi:hypothetical protein
MSVNGLSFKAGAALLAMIALITVGMLAPPALAQRDELDIPKAKQIRERFLNGEPITKEERAYLERAKAEFQRKKAANKAAGKMLTTPPKSSTGLVPLPDFPADARYHDQDGGLYGLGKNSPSDAQLKAALDAAKAIVPRDASGKPAADGKVVLASVGMSNTTQEFSRFKMLAARDASVSPSLVIVDGAQGGVTAAIWANSQRAVQAGRPDPWAVFDQRLKQAGVTPAQVQAIWLKQANGNPDPSSEFPKYAEQLKDQLAAIVRTLKTRCPNLQIVYLSSRIYGGYATTPLNPEPFAYESAFSVRWLIRDQVDGKTGLNHDAARGKVDVPVLLWGPYLWADGVKGRKSDRLVWNRADLADDGTHPSPSGRQKVAELLLNFLKEDSTAKSWFVKPAARS